MNKISALSYSSSLNHHPTTTGQRFRAPSLLLSAHSAPSGNAAPAVRRLSDGPMVYHGFLGQLIHYAHTKDEMYRVLSLVQNGSLSRLSAVCSSFSGGRRFHQGADLCCPGACCVPGVQTHRANINCIHRVSEHTTCHPRFRIFCHLVLLGQLTMIREVITSPTLWPLPLRLRTRPWYRPILV
jgi:hypothetical protein